MRRHGRVHVTAAGCAVACGSACAVAAALCLGTPRVLHRARWAVRRPAVALGLWTAGLAGGVVALVVAAGVLVAAGGAGRPGGAHGATDGAGGPAAMVLLALATSADWAVLLLLGASLSLVGVRAEPLLQQARATRALVGRLVGSSTCRTERLDDVAVAVVADPAPLALSVPGCSPGVVVSSRLRDELTAGQLLAVVAHERAHLERHHARLVQVARVQAACLPGFFPARAFERAVLLLVELDADDVAARRHGADAVAGALTTLAGLHGDATMQLRARRLSARGGHPGARRAGGVG